MSIPCVDRGPERSEVEQPLIDQLVGLGWTHTPGDLADPTATLRASFAEVLLEPDLRDALARINPGPDGESWLDEPRIAQAIAALQRHGARKVMEANQAVTERLQSGTAVEGLPGWDGGRSRTLHYLDWNHPERNTFRVVSQFRLDEPGGQAHRFLVPDLVLFVNGIPLVVVECKSPYVPEPIAAAIDQLQRYSNQRHWIDEHEGNERLFHFVQLLVASCGDEARVAAVGADSVHFLQWKDTSPVPMSEVARSLSKDRLSSQETLAAGMLRPSHLLDLVRHFTLFTQLGGKTVKLVARYQQFRAVREATRRLKTGKTRLEDGVQDRRGGIVWHTQGSGKSLTMVFLVRAMRSDPDLRRFKIVVVTDRTDLQDQLAGVAHLTGDVVRVATSASALKTLLAQPGPGLVFAMIQKYREPSRKGVTDEDERAINEGIDAGAADLADFPVLNEDEAILALVDEAHRSQGNTLHANLLSALPNCARIGFTGTPILMGDRKRTHDIFGDWIDRYTLTQSEADGATVPILYEGRTAEGSIADGRSLDALFEDFFRDYSPEELEQIKRKYATTGNVLEAPKLIAAKARDMLRHYVGNILPNGFKAQVVATSRLAAVRYFEAFQAARDDLLAQLDALDPALLELTPEQREHLDEESAFLVLAHRHRTTIASLQFAPVISGAQNDDPSWAEWTDPGAIRARITRFKKPLLHDDPSKRDPLAFLIVKSMLLTGFDAPIEQVMYLDRSIQAHELLQAIARVNRTYDRKAAGIVVDYFGVARHLTDALAVYASEDLEGALTRLEDEIPTLRDRHERVVSLFRDRGLALTDIEGCVKLLGDDRLRAAFQVTLKQFLTSLEIVLPRPEALPFVPDSRTLGLIQLRARNRYRGDERPIGRDVGEKVRRLIDEHVIARGVDPSIPPLSILDADFERHVEQQGSTEAKAAEMEHALRYHIRRHFDEDPERYQKLSERLEGILADLKDRWDDLLGSLFEFMREVKAGRQDDATGLDPETEAPFLGVLKQEALGDIEPDAEALRRLCDATVELVDHIRQEIRLVGFWQNPHAQEVLRRWVVQFLDDRDLIPWDRLPKASDRVVELAKVNHPKLIR